MGWVVSRPSWVDHSFTWSPGVMPMGTAISVLTTVPSGMVHSASTSVVRLPPEAGLPVAVTIWAVTRYLDAS
jgi:hypothetical protein